jgi:hypothetical protein
MADLDEQLRVLSVSINEAVASSLTATTDADRAHFRKKEEQLREERKILMRRQDASGK